MTGKAKVEMTLSKRQKARLESIIKQAEMILREARASETRSAGARKANSANTKGKKSTRAAVGRRTAADAAALRKEILAARKKGAKVAELAEKYGVTQSYIYQMR
jgi:Mor family transcriptional regulator